MVPTSAADGPIPPAKKDDSEDVAWALSTAEAMYARGDRGDALKWLRRAAEAASEAQADDRALELAKAAADLATALGPTTSARPPPPPPPPPVAGSRPAPALTSSPAPALSGPPPPPPPPAAVISTAPAFVPAIPPAAAASAPPPGATPSTAPPPPPASSPPPTARPFESKVTSPRSGAPSPLRPAEARRSPRRSRPDIAIARPPDEATQQLPPPVVPRPPPSEPARPRRRSRPPAAEVATPAFPPLVTTPRQPGVVPPPPPTPRALPAAEEIDARPAQSLTDDDLADPPDEKTRIGVPAYQVTALAPETGSPAPRTLDPTLKPAQAVRVVVWRAADGVHVAPQGTRVSAISVDAILVALDPSADLAAWLSGK